MDRALTLGDEDGASPTQEDEDDDNQEDIHLFFPTSPDVEDLVFPWGYFSVSWGTARKNGDLLKFSSAMHFPFLLPSTAFLHVSRAR